MGKCLTYTGKRIIGALICTVFFVISFLLFSYSVIETDNFDTTKSTNSQLSQQDKTVDNAESSEQKEEPSETKKAETENNNSHQIWMLVIALGILFAMYYVMLYVPAIPEPLAKICATIFPLLYSFKSADIWSTIWFLLSCFFFCILLFFINGYIKDSKHSLLAIRNRVQELFEDFDWIKQDKQDYAISVIPTNTIPNDISNVSSSDHKRLSNILSKFGRGSLQEKKAIKRMLLIGDFGSGKSSSILKYAYSQTNRIFINPNTIPIYIRLLDLFKEEENINELYQHNPAETNIWNERAKKLRNEIFNLYTIETDNPDTKSGSNYNKLHEENRILYLFDGFNEVLQKIKPDTNCTMQDYAYTLYNLLCKIAQGNYFVLTTCTYPGVITNTIIQNNFGGNSTKTAIYVIKGIELDKKKSIHQETYPYEVLLNSSVALYSLSKCFYQNKPTSYSLLNKYTECIDPNAYSLQNNNTESTDPNNDTESTDPNDSSSKLSDGFINIIISNIDNRSILYSPLTIENSSMARIPVFRKQDDKYITCHALFYEYMLARYAYRMLSNSNFSEDLFSSFFLGDSITFPNSDYDHPTIEKKAGTNKNQYEPMPPHIRDAFRMLIVDVFVKHINGKDDKDIIVISNCQKGIEKIYKSIPDLNMRLSYLLLLSRIKDDIMLYDFEPNNIKPNNINIGLNSNSISDLNKLIERASLPIRFQIYKLIPDITLGNCSLTSLLTDSMKEDWIWVGVQRKILKYYLKYYKDLNLDNINVLCDKDTSFAHNLAKYYMQEYQAELLKLPEESNGKTDNTEKSLASRIRLKIDYFINLISCPFNKKHDLVSFKAKRINGIKNKVYYYGFLQGILLIEIGCCFLLSDNIYWPAIIIKSLGSLFLILAYRAGNRQLWENEEYYGWALGDFSHDEPIYEVLEKTFSQKPFNTEESIVKESYTIIGDWLKNRPSIMFLLITIVSVIFTHKLIFHSHAAPLLSFLVEFGMAIIILLICCIPRSTWSYLFWGKKDNNKIPKRNVFIIISILFFTVFLLPIMATTLGPFFGEYIYFLFAIIGFVIFLLLKKYIISKAEGVQHISMCKIIISLVFILMPIVTGICHWEKFSLLTSASLYKTQVCMVLSILILIILLFCIKKKNLVFKKTEADRNQKPPTFSTNIVKRVAAFIFLFTCSISPAFLYFLRETNNAFITSGSLYIVLIAMTIYLSLFYATKAKKERKEERDAYLLSVTSQENNWKDLENNYSLLSCKGQISLLNKMINDENAMRNDQTMNILLTGAKTPQARDILLDAEINYLYIPETNTQ